MENSPEPTVAKTVWSHVKRLYVEPKIGSKAGEGEMRPRLPLFLTAETKLLKVIRIAA